MMQIMADQFPGAFSGYKLDVIESHQRNKADTSGTAKAVVQSFAQMGVNFKEVGSTGTCGYCIARVACDPNLRQAAGVPLLHGCVG